MKSDVGLNFDALFLCAILAGVRSGTALGLEPSTIVSTTTSIIDIALSHDGITERLDSESFLDYIHRVDGAYCRRHSFDFCSSHGNVFGTQQNISPRCAWNNPEPCTMPCECDVKCAEYEDCCPDHNNGTFILSSERRLSCVSSFINDKLVSPLAYKMVTKCRSDYADKLVTKMCEHFEESDTLDGRNFVSDESLTTYTNRYCAACNGAINVTKWRPDINCNRSFEIPSTLSKDEVIGYLWSQPGCQMQQVPPSFMFSGSGLRKCDVDDSLVISTCNVTGEWASDRYIADVVHACLSYTHVFQKKYRNPFCYICNSNTSFVDTCESSSGKNIVPAFSAIFDFRLATEDPRVECERGSIFDPTQGSCRRIHCPEGKWLTSSRAGNCSRILLTKTRIIYKTVMFYSLSRGIHVFCSDLTRFLDRLWSELMNSGREPSEMTGIIKVLRNQELTNCISLMPNSTMFTIFFRALFIELNYDVPASATDFNHDQFETDLIAHSKKVISIAWDNNSTITLQPDQSLFRQWHSSVALGRPYLSDSSLLLVREVPLSHPNYVSPEMFVHVSEFGVCPSIHLNEDEYTYENESASIYLRNLKTYVSHEEYEIYSNATVRMCLTVYELKLSQYTAGLSSNTADDEILVIISIVCTCLSVVCLLVTFIVYCLVRHLRTLPGKNNMAMVVCLAVSQLIFQFRPDKNDADGLCVTLGVLTHYMWLATLCWMNVCSIHMVRVFGRMNVTRQSKNKKRDNFTLLFYACYAHVVPAIIVGIHIVVSMTTNNNIGYRSAMCFISSKLMLGLLFALPIGLIVVSNIGMFLIVAIGIRRAASSSKMANTDTSYIHVYFRLSTLTGIMWLFGFVYQWTGNVVCSYIFTICVTLQGVFLFVAFVCNRRVFHHLSTQYNVSRSTKTTQTGRTRMSDVHSLDAIPNSKSKK